MTSDVPGWLGNAHSPSSRAVPRFPRNSVMLSAQHAGWFRGSAGILQNMAIASGCIPRFLDPLTADWIGCLDSHPARNSSEFRVRTHRVVSQGMPGARNLPTHYAKVNIQCFCENYKKFPNLNGNLLSKVDRARLPQNICC